MGVFYNNKVSHTKYITQQIQTWRNKRLGQTISFRKIAVIYTIYSTVYSFFLNY